VRKLIVSAAVISLALAAQGLAHAKPQYAGKEKKACAFCHVKPSGGMPLTAAGKYYKAHGHSLKGYASGKSAGGAMKPAKKK